MKAFELKIGKSKRGYGIFAGVSKLMGFKTEADAVDGLKKHRGILEFWANSASVSIENSECRILNP